MKSGTSGYKLWNQVGIIDQEYRGEVFVKLYNDTNDDIVVIPGAKIAQMVFKKAIITKINLVDDFNSETSRGENGFGSTIDHDN